MSDYFSMKIDKRVLSYSKIANITFLPCFWSHNPKKKKKVTHSLSPFTSLWFHCYWDSMPLLYQWPMLKADQGPKEMRKEKWSLAIIVRCWLIQTIKIPFTSVLFLNNIKGEREGGRKRNQKHTEKHRSYSH